MRYVNFIFYTVFVSLLLGIAGLLIGSMLPIPGNIEVKIVKSGSMEPNIPTGSLVVVKPESRYSIGDIITFGADTQTSVPTTHRIIGFAGENGETAYTTKGDANEEADTNTVARSEVIGKIVFHVPAVGFILDFARQPLGFALLIGIPAALVILEEIITITKEVKLALRRRRSEKDGDDADRDGGTPHATETRLVYLRRRAMDEIFVPMVTGPSILRTALRQHEPRQADAYGVATMLVMGLVFVSSLMSGGAGGTIAYFSDIERSLGNIFQAGSGDDFLDGREVPIQQLVVEEEQEPELRKTAALVPEEEGEVLGATDEAVTTEEEPEGGGGGTESTQTPANESITESITEPAGGPTEPPAAELEGETPAEGEVPVEPEQPVSAPEPTPEPAPAEDPAV